MPKKIESTPVEQAYITTMCFTEAPDSMAGADNAYLNLRVSNGVRIHARAAIDGFFKALDAAGIDITGIDVERLANCLWYDRNWHGTGIRDEAAKLAPGVADKIYRIAESMQPVNVGCFGDCLVMGCTPEMQASIDAVAVERAMQVALGMAICGDCMSHDSGTCDAHRMRRPDNAAPAVEAKSAKCAECANTEIDAPGEVRVQNEFWCAECALAKCVQCENCGELIDGDDAGHGELDASVCYNCGREGYITCNGCFKPVSHLESVERDNCDYCPACAANKI